ncbi:ectoine/hydroxyectoine ABC transporter substrate-binding protein EhuB [Paraburkholderia phytofirmans]
MALFPRFLLSVLLSISLIAAVPVRAEQTKDRVLEERSITIGMFNNAPWAFKTADGAIAGVHPDLIRAVLAPLGIKDLHFLIMDFGALIPSLLAKRVDVVASGMAITPARCQQVIFSEPDLAGLDALLVKKGNPLKIHSYQDVVANPAVRMGGGRGSSQTENAIKAGIPEQRIQLYPDVDSAVSALLAGRVDALTYSVASVNAMMKESLVQGRLEVAAPFKGLVLKNGHEAANYGGMAFRPEDTQLRDLYNASFKKLKADGTVKKILAKYGFTEAPDDVTTKELCSPS